MSNPLIAKWEELYGPKKEEPKKVASVATSNTGTTAANPFPFTKLTTHDIDSINDSFLQIAEKIKNKEAQVWTMNMDYEHHTRTQRITFEILTNF